MFFCTEDQRHATVDVMRIGNVNSEATVAFQTSDGSAIANKKYISTKGTLEFKSGEVLKSINIPIIDDHQWDSTLEFQVQLLELSSNCVLGRELWKTRVLILDDDIFPSNVYKREIMSGNEEVVAAISVKLLVAYIKFVFLRVPTVWWKATLTLLVDQLWNVYYIMTIYMRVYLVDVILNVTDPSTSERCLVPGNRSLSAFALAVCWVAPNFVLLVVGRIKVGPLDMCKAIRQHFQVNLFRKYMNFTEDSKREVPVQDLTMAMDADIPMLVDDGFMCLFDIVQGIGKILVVAFFMLMQDPRCIIPLLVFPTVMLLFLKSRQEQDIVLETALIQSEAGATGIIVNSFEGFNLIRDYGVRQAMVYRYSGSLSKSKDANDNMIAFKYWNAQLVPWLTLICVGVNLALGSQAVLLGQMSIGSFLAMVQIYQELGSRFQGIYDSLEACMQAGSPLCELTKMLNLQTDMPHRLAQTNARRKYMLEKISKMQPSDMREEPTADLDETGKAERKYEIEKSETFASLFDRIPISIVGLSIPYIGALSNVHAEVQAGSLVFITGSHATGKATLVKLLADIHVPERGSALFSAHSRCLHVSNQPEVLPYLSLYQNLTFGAAQDDPELVRRTLNRLGLGSHWIATELDRQIKAHDPGFTNNKLRTGQTNAWSKDLDSAVPDDESWAKRLSFRERRMINFARALLYNPEILVLQKPLDDCDIDDVATILSVLREYVDQRGIGGEGSISGRRPRTVFFSGGTFHHSKLPFEMSDVVWHLHNVHGVTVELGGNGKHFHLPNGPSGSPGAHLRVDADVESKLMDAENTLRQHHSVGIAHGGHDEKEDHGGRGPGTFSRLLQPYVSPRQIKMRTSALHTKKVKPENAYCFRACT